jgi:hypothetical protein
MTPSLLSVAYPVLAMAICFQAGQDSQASPRAASEAKPPAQKSEAVLTSPSEPNAQGTVDAVVLREGTPIKLKLLHTLNSKTVVVDDPLNFAVVEDVVVDGNVVIKAGAPATGRVLRAKPARTFGRGAELRLHLDHVRAGAVRVPLRSSLAREGKDKTGETVALVMVFGLSGLVKHGSEVEVKEGSKFDAFVDEDTTVAIPRHAENGLCH